MADEATVVYARGRDREWAEIVDVLTQAGRGHRSLLVIGPIAVSWDDQPWTEPGLVLAFGLLVCDTDQRAFWHELVRSAVAESEPIAPRRLDRSHDATRWASLTDTERTIAHLISQGMTNRQIATRVHLSPHTVNYHLRQIFRKLDINSRVRLAGIAQANLPEPPVAAA